MLSANVWGHVVTVLNRKRGVKLWFIVECIEILREIPGGSGVNVKYHGGRSQSDTFMIQ